MKNNIVSRILVLAMVVIAYSCGRGDKSGLAVPKDASVVVHINSGGLTKKLSWEEIKATNWFKKMYEKADDSLAKKLLENPSASGIDIEKDLMFFVKKQGRGSYMVFEGFVKDAAAFGQFNTQINKGATISKSGDFSIMKLEQDGMLSFNNERFVYIVNAPGIPNGFSPFNGQDGAPREPQKFSADSLQIFATTLFDLPSDQSLYKDDRFAGTMKESGDMHVWINNEKAYGDLASGMLSMFKMNALFEKNATGMTLNFDNGKVLMTSNQYFGDELRKVLEKYPAKDISAEAINRIQSQDVVAAFVMNYPPEGLKAMLKLFGFDGAANAYLQEIGYSIDEFVKANKGELVISVSDIKLDEKSAATPPPPPPAEPDAADPSGAGPEQIVPGAGGIPQMKFLFATSINDKAAFDKMVGIISAKFGDISKGGPFDINYNMNKDWFVVGNAKDQVDAYLAGPKGTQPFASRISGKPFGAFIDLQKIMTKFPKYSKDSTAARNIDLSVKMWQDVLITGGKMKNGALSYEAELNLVNKSENSLKQLNRYFDEISKNDKNTIDF